MREREMYQGRVSLTMFEVLRGLSEEELVMTGTFRTSVLMILVGVAGTVTLLAS